MDYTVDEVLKYIEEEDGKFIRLAFRDAFGNQKNISVMPGEIKKAFDEGIPVNARVIAGFESSPDALVYLKPDPSTLTVLPWRPDSGRVLRMFCDVVNSEGKTYEADTRAILRAAAMRAESAGVEFRFGSKTEFYLLKKDDEGNPTKIPYDQAGYMDIAPLDKCENIRREISLTIEKMGLVPERSHHERGPGQNEIDFHYAKPLKAADQLTTFKMVVSTVADRNGLVADFSPRPLEEKPGNGYQIDIYVPTLVLAEHAMRGILEKYKEIMIFLNSGEDCLRDTSVRIREHGGKVRLELRLSGARSNPYLVYALLIHAGLYGVEKYRNRPSEDLETGEQKTHQTMEEAKESARFSSFVQSILPREIIEQYTGSEPGDR